MSHPVDLPTLARTDGLALLLDFDGTLVPFAPTPDGVVVDDALESLLRRLTEQAGLRVAIVSGRPRSSLESLVGHLERLVLVSDHGGFARVRGEWIQLARRDAPLARLDQLEQDLEALLPGTNARIERKELSVCLHYRGVARNERAAFVATASALIGKWLEVHDAFELLESTDALEVRVSGVDKGLAVELLRRQTPGARIFALGDDITDEDVFRALRDGDLGVRVLSGPKRPTAAKYAVPTYEDARALLHDLLALRRGESQASVPLVRQSVIPSVAAAERTSRLVVVSNRLPDLPAHASEADLGDTRRRNVGGLVAALEPVLEKRHGIWLGWSGRAAATAPRGLSGIAEDSAPALAWLDFPPAWRTLFYNGFCNRSLWPLFHSLTARIRYEDREWQAYVDANHAFAAATRELAGVRDSVWVHDYHLMLVAAELERLGHRGPRGFFLHVPFPAVELIETIPWARTVLESLLAFDLVGFHTRRYADNFARSVAELVPDAHVEGHVVSFAGRTTQVAASPIGIAPDGFSDPEPDAEADEELEALVRSLEDRILILGVDRLDYTKGIPHRLRAFARLLECQPEWRGKVSFVQIAVPSRADVPDYEQQRAEIQAEVGRINGEYGEAHWVPIRYLYRAYDRARLARIYRAARVALVTPLRDGMNLVAKEFVVAQDPADPGVLVLSRFAGAAESMHAAVLANPFHPDGLARDIDRALRMPREERASRHTELLGVAEKTAIEWAEAFLARLDAVTPRP